MAKKTKIVDTGIEKLDAYCRAVYSGEIEVCKYVKLAVKRHYRDLKKYGVNHYDTESGKFEKDQKEDFYFDPAAAQYYVNFFEENLCHYDSVHAGKPFIFEPWQWFAFASPFGWLKKDRINDVAIRRFSELDIFVPKKQGKSIWIAGTMLFMLEFDGVPGAQNYGFALSQSHVKTLGFNDATILVKESPTLNKRYNRKKGAAYDGIYFDENNSFIKPYVSDAKKADGPKIHFAANDEVKDWEDFDLYNTIVNGTAADPTAIIANITTAGDNKISVGYERQNHIENILEEKVVDEYTFGVIYGIDTDKKEGEEKSKDELEWDTERVWKKANPNYGISVQKDYYEKRVASAKSSQANKNDFLIKHLNCWVDALSGWLNMDAWDACGDAGLKIEDVKEYDCIVSIDLASKIDLAVVEKSFFKNGECWTFPTFYLPEGILTDDSKYNDAMVSQIKRWASDGYITLTPGPTIDYDIIEQEVLQAFRDYNVINMPYDPWNATQFVNGLHKKGIDEELTVEYGQQGYAQWTEPMKEAERMILNGLVHHDKNPVMRWNMGNVVTRVDNNDNIRPLKQLPQNKIDGAIAFFMSIALGMIREEESQGEWDEVVFI